MQTCEEKRKLKGKRGSYRDNACLIFFSFKGRIKGIVSSCFPVLTECYTRTYRKFINRLDSQLGDGEKAKKIIKQNKHKPPMNPRSQNKMYFRKTISTNIKVFLCT